MSQGGGQSSPIKNYWSKWGAGSSPKSHIRGTDITPRMGQREGRTGMRQFPSTSQEALTQAMGPGEGSLRKAHLRAEWRLTGWESGEEGEGRPKNHRTGPSSAGDKL